MLGRLVEISTDGRHASLHRGFMLVRNDEKEELGRIPLDDICGVIGSAHGLTWSNNLLCALAERAIPVVLSNARHQPVGILWAASGHFDQTGRIADQIDANKPLKKRLWQEIVRCKIKLQGSNLAAQGHEAGAFDLLARQVKSGDPENIEAQAARRYWRAMFGPNFRRDAGSDGVNSLLNYIYAVIRTGMARAVMAGGLHPSIGLHHKNRGNPFVLVDDLMEVFRPAGDLLVLSLVRDGADELTAEVKKQLATILVTDLRCTDGAAPMINLMEQLIYSLAECFAGRAKNLRLPTPQSPLESYR